MSSPQELPPHPSRQASASSREVFRGTGAVVLWWAWVAVTVVALGDLAAQGRDHGSAVAAAVVISITALMYACALRPRVVADDEGITVENPLREHRVPWTAVTRVDMAGALRVHCAAPPGAARGKIVQSWAVQASPLTVRMRQATAMRAQRRSAMTGRAGGYGRSPGYGRRPTPAKQQADRTHAEIAVRRLRERAEQVRQEGVPPGQPAAQWAWVPIATVLAPVALLIVVVLA